MLARSSLPTICVAIGALVVPTTTNANSISIHAGDPQLPGMVSAVWQSAVGDVVHNLQMRVDGTMTSSDMAAVTTRSLHSIPGVDPASVSLVGDHVNVDSTPLLDPLDGVLPGGSIYWGTGTTAQESMKLLSPEISHATVAAIGHFAPFSQPQQPAIFTAGIVTDVGELTAQISSQELNFQTDGPIICQALFQRLAPRAPQYGAQINYAGDRLEVYFDPAYTVTQGGIVFGTTSPSQGYSGTIKTAAEPAGPIPGDNNGDGMVDAADYVELRKGIETPYGQASYNLWREHFGESAVGGSVLGTSSLHAVPEPANLVLILIGTLATVACRKHALANQPLTT